MNMLAMEQAEAMANDLMRLAVLYSISMLEEDKYCCANEGESDDTELSGWAWVEAEETFQQREKEVRNRWDVEVDTLGMSGVLQEVGYHAGMRSRV